jgi:structural maintenance of chromosome 4
MKRKRSQAIPSDLEEEATFVNNSDYDVASSDVANVSHDDDGGRHHDRDARDENEAEPDKTSQEAVENDEDRESDEYNESEDDKNDNEDEHPSEDQRANEVCEVPNEDNANITARLNGDNSNFDGEIEQTEESDAFVDGDLSTKSEESNPFLGPQQVNGTIINSENLSNGLTKLKVPLLEPTSSQVNVTTSSSSNQLSYSQQQAQIELSPSKRRLIPQPVRKDVPRLVIRQLVLTNFKSYAGKQVIGPFNSSFSAVVGPNGSGKSNVIDSMLFVFGFRASKMRQSKLSELIHNSTDGETLDFCRVDIHFHNVLDDPNDESVAHVIPDSEIVISRKAMRNNQSMYYINDKTSTYTEVTNFLRDKGIDLDHKRFLILQGEVESIAQMKAKAERENEDGLLEYLEDIIGTSNYKEQIEQSLVKVDELNEVCLEKENRFELVEKDKEELEDKKNEALKFLEMEKDLIFKRSINYQANIIEGKMVMEQNEQTLNKLQEKLKEEEDKNSELMSSIKEYTEKRDGIKSEIKALNQRLESATKRQKEINRQKVSLEEKHKNLNAKIKKNIKNKESSEQALQSSTLKLQNYNSAAAKFKEEMETLEKDLELEKLKLSEIRKKLTAKTEHFTKEIGDLQTKLDPWNEKMKEKENSIQLVQSEVEMLKTQRENTSKQIENSRQRLVDIKAEGRQKEGQLHEAEAKLEKVEEQIQLGGEQCALEKRKVDAIMSQLSDMRTRTQEAVNSLNNFQSKNKVLASLMRLAKSGRIDGFHGRLGDLGTIDDKYDIAISTACPGLDSMVVDTVETAQACIDYLRKNKLGYANFICLNKLRKFDLSPIKTPGNPAVVKRLFDLIRPQQAKFAPAFYSKIYNTLVAPDLKEAKQVAYGAKRWKVVTLDGKVVDTSGTMSGGGNYFAKGGMRLTNATNPDAMDISPEDVDLLKADVAKMEAKYDKAKFEYDEKLAMLQKLRQLKPDTELEISRLQLDIEALAAERKEVMQLCKSLIAENESLNTIEKVDHEIGQKEAQLNDLNTERSRLKSQMADLESQIKVLEDKVMEAGGVELKVQNSRVDSTKQKIEILNQKTSGDRMAIRKLENEINRHTKVIEQSTAELESTNEEYEKIVAMLQEKKTALQEITNEIEVFEKEKNDKESALEVLESELEETLEQINKFKSFQIEMENKMEKYTAIIKKTQRNIDENTLSLEGLTIRDVSSYIEWLDEKEQKTYDGELRRIDEKELKSINMEQVEHEIEQLEEYMNTVKVDIEVLKEYGKKKTEYETRREDLNLSVEERDTIKGKYEELKRKRLDEFMEGFNTISMTLKDMYRMITMGGNAELELVDSLDPFSEGILFSVMPPKKSWKNISNLSGGEKTLSSLALVFALHQYKPTPLYVMDEIDAALDFRNVSIVANYIKDRTKNGQFIVISLRNNMFELAQQLVGIYKVNNMTKSISLQNKDFIEV